MSTKKCYILVFLIISFSCSSKKNSIYFETIPKQYIDNENRFDLDNVVYPVNRKVLYQCTIKNNNNLSVRDTDLRYVRMIVQGTTKPFSSFDPDYSQTVIKFEYLDVNKKQIARERTGLVENKINIWLHPPRQIDLHVLQLSAFPYINLNAIKKWKWKLDASYGNYQNVNLTHYYKKNKEVMYDLDLGQFKCVLVEAISKSRIGTTKAEFLYNDELGFVKMQFSTIEDTTITLEMIKE